MQGKTSDEMIEKARQWMNDNGIYHSINILPAHVASFAEQAVSEAVSAAVAEFVRRVELQAQNFLPDYRFTTEYEKLMKVVAREFEPHNCNGDRCTVCPRGRMYKAWVAKEMSQSPWISVGERLPAQSGRVLITAELPDMPPLVTSVAFWVKDETRFAADNLHLTEHVWNEYIIAWMPLPEPYKPSETQEGE